MEYNWTRDDNLRPHKIRHSHIPQIQLTHSQQTTIKEDSDNIFWASLPLVPNCVGGNKEKGRSTKVIKSLQSTPDEICKRWWWWRCGEDILIITTSSGSVPNNFIFIGFGGSLPMNIPHFSHVFNQLNLIFVALHGPTNKTQSSGGGFYYFWDSVPSRIILLSSSSSILQRLLWRWRCCSPRGGFVI